MISRFLFLFFILLGSITSVFAQAPGPVLTDLPKIIPPTPDAAALEKFGMVPVNFATGIPNISYPFWDWKKGRLAFAMGLSYHAGGHKVDDMSPTTGLGWALTGLGRVSRTVRGLPDDHPTMGYIYTPVLPPVTTYSYDGQYYATAQILSAQQTFNANIAITQYNSPYSSAVQQIANGQLDGEQDVFSFSFGGNSGRFVFNKNKEIVPLEHTNCKIVPIYSSYSNGNPTGRISAFTITDDKGIIYKFEYNELQNSQGIDDSQTISANTNQEAVSGWLLTKIIDPMVNDTIILHYVVNGSTNYETSFGESHSYSLDHFDPGAGQVIPGVSSSMVSSFSIISSDEAQVNYIEFPDGSKANFIYGFNRLDLLNSKALTEIKISNSQLDLVKWFQLDYSYFIASGTTFSPSGNDGSKRLKLLGIKERSIDGISNKQTVFTYNGLALNPRGSKNIDYWGYNVDPARNNPYYAPIVKLEDQELALNPQYGRYLNGADRSPDNIYSKAAVLERIDYPTGGFTVFDYECNKAFSSVNYYEDGATISPISWSQGNFGQAMTINLANRTSTAVKFLFKTNELSVRPTPDPNGLQSCLDGQQDNYNVIFIISSIDNSFSTTVQGTYGEFVGGGFTRTIELPLNKTYRVTFVYNYSDPCAFMYPFYASLNGTYYIAPRDKLVGGVRIKKITLNDGNNKTLIKEYTYNNSDGHSSAVLDKIPDFGYYRTTVDYGSAADFPRITHHINHTNNPTNTLNYYSSAPLIYQNVQERELDGSLTERQFEPLVTASNGGNGFYPFLPWQDIQNFSGLLKSQTIKDNLGTTKTYQTKQYDKSQLYHLNPENRNIKTGTIATAVDYNAKYYVADQYFMYTTNADETQNAQVSYEGGNQISSIQNKTYEAVTHYLSSETISNSKNNMLKTEYLYPKSFYGINPYTSMVNNNMIGLVIQQSDYVNNNFLKSAKNNYFDWGNSFIAPSVIELQTGSSAPYAALQYYGYDAKGNVLKVAKSDKVDHSYIWGYTSTYPVAEIVGAGTDPVCYSSFEEEGSGNWSYSNTGSIIMVDAVTGKNAFNLNGNTISKTGLNSAKTYVVNYWLKNSSGSCSLGGTAIRVTNLWILYQAIISNQTTLTISGTGIIDELRMCVKDAMMTTYTYKPLVGITSICDANNRITYYEYDNFNRVKVIRDQEKNILKKYCYTYNGQQSNCSAALFGNALVSQTFTRNNCNLGETGSLVNYIVPQGRYTAATQSEADQLAQNDINTNGQTYANTVGTCNSNPCAACINVVFKRCINNVCVRGIKVYTSSTYNSSSGQYDCVYHYEWPDGFWSIDYNEQSSTSCL